MTVSKRNGKWFVDFWFQHADGTRERVRKLSPKNTKASAEEYERQLRGDMLSPNASGKGVRFEDYAKEFQDVYVKANLKYATQIGYESVIRVHLTPAFGKRKLEEIDSKSIERFKAKLLAGGRSNSTVRNIQGVLSRMLHIAEQWGYIARVPKFNLPKVPVPRFRFLDDEEVAAVLAHAGPYWYPPIYFALMTGCRQGELWAMERDQLDLANAVVHVDRAVYRGRVGLPKHDKVRTVDLSPKLVAFLRQHLQVVSLRSRLVFPKPDGGMRLERKADMGLRRVAKRAGVEPFGWHVARHTFASRMVMKGVPLQVVQQLLGHSRIDETMRYAHISPHMKRDAVALLDGNETQNFGPQLVNGTGGAS